MTAIKNNYDLSGGNAESDVVSNPNNWRVTATVSGMPDGQAVDLLFYVAGDDLRYAPLRDVNDRHIKIELTENGSVSVNLAGVNASKGKIAIVTPTSSIGILYIDSINS